MTLLEKATAEIIQRSFNLPEVQGDDEMQKMRALLIEKLDQLLDHDFEKLISILYRIDVDEQKAKAALAAQSTRKPSEVLADIIIERQIEKAKTRLRYDSGRTDF